MKRLFLFIVILVVFAACSQPKPFHPNPPSVFPTAPHHGGQSLPYHVSIYTLNDIYHLDFNALRIFTETGAIDTSFLYISQFTNFIESMTAADAVDCMICCDAANR